jgi:Tfp pilus assembly protein PilO
MSEGQKPKSMLVTILVSGAALAYAFLVFLPMQKSIASLRSKLREQRDYIGAATTADATIADLALRKREAGKIVQRWRDHAPSPHQMSTFIGTVSELADQAGAKAGSITPGDTVKLASLRMHPADLAVEGEFHEIAEFLTRLERRDETIWIGKLNVQPIPSQTKLRCQVSFTVFADNPADSD